MTDAIDLTTEQRTMLTTLLRRFLPGVAVWAYGSRVKWTARPNSDLDLVAFATPAQRSQVTDLKEALAESNLPFPVGLHVWDDVPERFREIIRKENVVVQEAKQPKSSSGGLGMADETLPKGWTWTTLGTVADFVNGDRSGNYPTQSDRVEAGVPFINTGHIDPNGRLTSVAMDYITRDSFERLRSGKVKAGDIVYCLRGSTIGKTARNHFTEGAIASSLVIVRAKANACQEFLYFYLTSPMGQQLVKQHDNGSAQPNLSVRSLCNYPLPLPPLPEQRAIAHILGTLDDKIDLNRKMNETLEAMARTLFKSWFVDFDPVRAKAEGRDPGLPKHIADLFPDSFADSELGEIPKGWEVGTIGAMADVIDCLHSRKPERRESGVPLLQLSNIRDDGLIDMQDTYLIGEADYQKWVSRMEASPGDCVITNVGRVGAVAQMPANQKAALGRNMTGIRCKPTCPYPTFLIECLLSQAMKDEIALKMDTGTILDALNVRNIPRLRFSRPGTPEVIECFERKAKPLRAQMERNLAASQTLAILRDTLLPKLISGELRVKDAERFMERAV